MLAAGVADLTALGLLQQPPSQAAGPTCADWARRHAVRLPCGCVVGPEQIGQLSRIAGSATELLRCISWMLQPQGLPAHQRPEEEQQHQNPDQGDDHASHPVLVPALEAPQLARQGAGAGNVATANSLCSSCIKLTVSIACCARGYRTSQCICSQQLRCSCNRQTVAAMAGGSCEHGACTAEAVTSLSGTAIRRVEIAACNAGLQVLHYTSSVVPSATCGLLGDCRKHILSMVLALPANLLTACTGWPMEASIVHQGRGVCLLLISQTQLSPQ